MKLILKQLKGNTTLRKINNQELKEIVKLKQKKYRRNSKLVLIEGFRLLDEIARHNIFPKTIYFSYMNETLKEFNDKYSQIEFVKISQNQLMKMTFTENPQSLVAVINYQKNEPQNFKKALFLDKISDPGNMGTIIRTAVAAQIEAIFVSPDSVDLYNEKVVRSSMGSVFFAPIKICSFDKINLENVKIFSATIDDEAKSIYSYQKQENGIIVIGSEAHGISNYILEKSTHKIIIPLNNQIESLNAAVSSGILISHLFGF